MIFRYRKARRRHKFHVLRKLINRASEICENTTYLMKIGDEPAYYGRIERCKTGSENIRKLL